MKIRIPGKTFLVGEYAVLTGGPALGLATSPFFVVDPDTEVKSKFHAESPAGRFLTQKMLSSHYEILNEYEVLNIQGGFGSSTAEFWSCYLKSYEGLEIPSYHEIFKTFKSLFESENRPPSGVDLAFQYFGQVTLADPKAQYYQSMDWMFSNLEFSIVPTKMKVPTHEHLSSLNSSQLEGLADMSNDIINSFLSCDEPKFLYGLKNWINELEQRQLTHLNSMHLRRELEKNSEIILAKPCGALGADVILLIYRPADKVKVNQILSQMNLASVANRNDLQLGIRSQVVNQRGKYVG